MFPVSDNLVAFIHVPSLGECLGGALWWKDLYKTAEEVGFSPPRLVTASQITLANKELENIVGKRMLCIIYSSASC